MYEQASSKTVPLDYEAFKLKTCNIPVNFRVGNPAHSTPWALFAVGNVLMLWELIHGFIKDKYLVV